MPTEDPVPSYDDTTVSLEKEYESLRNEIERRSTVQQAVFALNLVAVGAIVSLALKLGPTGMPAPPDSTRSFLLMLLIPYVGFALARLWLDHHDAIRRLGGYIRTVLESRSGASWETFLETKGRSARFNHYMFFFAYAVVFAGPGVVGLIATMPHAHGLHRQMMWLLALALVLLNLYGWTVACWSPKVRSMTLSRLRTMFEPRVRTSLNWDHLAAAAKVEVAEYYVDEDGDYEGWWMPWYYRTDPEGTRVEVQEQDGGRAIRLLDCGHLPTRADGLWDPKVDTVSEFDGKFAFAPMKFDACVYALTVEDGRVVRIILDGNHHLAAALRSGNSFTARVFEIRNGPTEDARVLQDLGRDWAGDGSRPRAGGHEA